MLAFDNDIYILSFFGISLRIKFVVFVILQQEIPKKKKPEKEVFFFHRIICKRYILLEPVNIKFSLWCRICRLVSNSNSRID